jgi:hypothetical protein
MILLQRMCWNTNRWKGPTGNCYMQEDSWVGTHGFGLEEWNFNTNDVIDGAVYGYLYYTPPWWNSRVRQPNDIYFFTLTPWGKRLLVGAYHGAEFISISEKNILKDSFQKAGILNRRIDELLSLELPPITSSSDAQRLLIGDNFALNIKVAPENLEPYDPPRELRPEDIGGMNPAFLNRYTRPTQLNSSPTIRRIKTSRVKALLPQGSDEELLTHPYMRYTEAQRQVIRRHHANLSNRFRAWLRKIGATNIRAESEYTDVVCSHQGLRYLFELKACYNKDVHHSLREALGQILDYAFYPHHRRVDRLAIVLDYAPSQLDLAWIRSLIGIGLKLDVFWFRGETCISAGLNNSPLDKIARNYSA